MVNPLVVFQPLTTLEVTNFIGIVAFSIAGSIKGIEKRMDLLGILTLGFSSSLAGGIIADILLGIHPPVNLVYIPYPTVAFLSSLFTFFLYRKITIKNPLLYADALGLGAFTASGASLAYSVDPRPLLVIIVGTVTSVGGGVLRDILANEIPLILTKEFYASASIVGSSVYFLLMLVRFPPGEASILVLFLTFLLRIIAIRFKWELPRIKSI
ncbi:trimeric intracellular cation channel family protein [Candidatus Acidianus copahuensis]|nr:trimeric intracellular cation channel family protein [Candidatus Acidianus copahuensis]